MTVIPALGRRGRKITRPVYIVNLRLVRHTRDSKEEEEEGMEAAPTSCWNHSPMAPAYLSPSDSSTALRKASGDSSRFAYVVGFVYLHEFSIFTVYMLTL